MIVEISKRTTSAAQKLLRVSALVLIASHATAQNPVVKTVTTMDQLKNDFISAAAATNMANEMCNQVRPSKWSRAGAYILGGHTKINIDSTNYGDVRQAYFQKNASVTATQSHLQAPPCIDLGTKSQPQTQITFSRSKKAVISNSATTSFSNAIRFDASVGMNIPGVDATVSSGFVQTSGTSSTAVSSSSDTSSTKLTKKWSPSDDGKPSRVWFSVDRYKLKENAKVAVKYSVDHIDIVAQCNYSRYNRRSHRRNHTGRNPVRRVKPSALNSKWTDDGVYKVSQTPINFNVDYVDAWPSYELQTGKTCANGI
jgi:hypothetical protein